MLFRKQQLKLACRQKLLKQDYKRQAMHFVVL
jgi:hypothetical protein